MAISKPVGAGGVLRVITALASIIACLLAAVAFHVLLGAWGRDPRPAGAFMAIALATAALYLAGRRAHRASELIVALITAELLFVAAIGWFADGGLPHFGGFFFSWFIPGSLFLALPWLIGMALGAYVRRRRSASLADLRAVGCRGRRRARSDGRYRTPGGAGR